MDIQAINLAVEHGFVVEQLVLWQDGYFDAVEVHESGAGVVEEQRFPALMRVVVDARVGGGVADFDEYAGIVEGHVGNIPGGAEVGQRFANDVGLHFFQGGLSLIQWGVQVDVDKGALGSVGFGGETAYDLVGDVVAVEEGDDPVEGLVYLLCVVCCLHGVASNRRVNVLGR